MTDVTLETLRAATDIRINRLSYRLLGVLLREPTSGYEVVKALEKFRPVNISQVYPALSGMEEKGLLISEEIVQEGKPNKKIYHATPLAHEVVRQWIDSPSHETVVHDDFIAKVFSFWTAGTDAKRALIMERIEYLDSEITYFGEKLTDLHLEYGDAVLDPEHWPFSRDILMRRRLALYHEERLWCHRILERLDRDRSEGGDE